MDERREALLKKVRALLAKADDRAVTQAEADAFREKADELMIRYAVEEYELRTTGEVKPVARHVTNSWFHLLDPDSRGQAATDWLFQSVYGHCRCSIIFKEQDMSAETIAVVGYESDLDYADLLFTSLLLQLARAMSPRPDPALSYEENLQRMFLAGIPWPEITERMIGVGMLWDGYEGGWARAEIERRFILDRKRWAVTTGREEVSRHPSRRESFAWGFSNEIGDRLEAMRARSASYETVSGTRFELVTRDIEQRVSSAALELFPHSAPHATDCRCWECSWDRGDGATLSHADTFDRDGYREGFWAGKRADIIGRGDSRLGSSQRAITE